MSQQGQGRIRSALREFLTNEASAGLVLMGVALAALIVANSPAAPTYFAALQAKVGGLSLQHWINDALMAVFFLLVGLEIKRELLDGQLSTWPRRILPGLAAAGGMLVPALIFVAFNSSDAATLRGWAIPTATDIAFALGVMTLLGPRVPTSLKIFLTALAIIDDLGAVIIIAIFYTGSLSVAYLAAAAVLVAVLFALNAMHVRSLTIYLAIGAVLWFCVLKSGVHATIAGVLLALTIPLRETPGRPEALNDSPLHLLEHALQKPVAFLVVPIFGFANAGVSLKGVPLSAFVEPLSLGIAVGLVVGKLIGVFGAVALTIRLRLAPLPAGASWIQVLGVALLCGIGFTMSLFVGLLAFEDVATQDRAKLGILMGSLVAGLLGYLLLRFASSDRKLAVSSEPH